MYSRRMTQGIDRRGIRGALEGTDRVRRRIHGRREDSDARPVHSERPQYPVATANRLSEATGFQVPDRLALGLRMPLHQEVASRHRIDIACCRWNL